MPQPEFTARRYRPDEDYDWLVKVWATHGDVCLPADVLPPTGIVLLFEGVRWACSMWWLTNAKTVILGPSVVDGDLAPRLQAIAITAALEAAVTEVERQHPDCMLWAPSHSASVRNVFVNRFDFCDTGVVHTAAKAGARGFSLDIISAGGPT